MGMIICFRYMRRVRMARHTITFMALARFAFEIFLLARASRTHNAFGGNYIFNERFEAYIISDFVVHFSSARGLYFFLSCNNKAHFVHTCRYNEVVNFVVICKTSCIH